MNDMRNKEPKVFWKMFKKKTPDKSCNATRNDLFKHFKNNEDKRETFEELDIKIKRVIN